MKMITGNMTASREVRGADFYASPYEALPPLLWAERRHLPRTLWEPSCGNGALVLPLRNRGYDVTATDLHDWGCPQSASGVDFLTNAADAYPPTAPFGIVSNPPFSIIKPYVEHAVRRAPYVALLLRLAFLESESRMDWFPTVGLRRVHILSDRLPMMHRHGYHGPRIKTGSMCFAWYIFERDKPPQRHVPLRWFSWKRCLRRFPMMPEDRPLELEAAK